MRSPAAAAVNAPANELLDRLCAPRGDRFDCHDVLAVVAHPDDETIALGGQIARMRGLRLLHVTDGAPEDMHDAREHGFSWRMDYADARRRELAAAMEMAGIGEEALFSLGVVDQKTAFRMAELAPRLAAMFSEAGIRTVLTHAYEGGHPDHDATAFLVHAACRLLEREGLAAPSLVDFPLYHSHKGAIVVQEFTSAKAVTRECTIALDEAAAERKRRMLAAYVTQRRTLQIFTSVAERFRIAPSYNFSRLPNGGDLYYEQFDWGLTGADWQRLAEEARKELDLPQWF